MIKKHVKPNPQLNKQGGIIEQEAPIHISNVMLVDSEGKPTRIGFQIEGDKKTRIARTNGGAVEVKKDAKK
jgi:large subunit ribosomal protein L24